MLDLKYIRENHEIIKKGIADKQLTGTIDLDKLLDLDNRYTLLLKKVETYRALRNKLSEDISKVSKEERQKLIDEASNVKSQLSNLEEELKTLKTQIDELMLWVPNPPAWDVPIAPDESGNKVIKIHGNLPKFSFTPKDHVEILQNLGMIDLERGSKIAGFRGYFLVNDGVELESALLSYAKDLIKSKGFSFYTVPWMVNKEYLKGTGYFPWGEEDHYSTQDNQALIGTAEVSLTSLYANEILEESELPKLLAGISPCFRREVGSHGKDTRGVIRVHQFQKVEQVVLLPEGEELTREWHDRMLSYSEELLQGLEIPYQVLLMCSGDMGAGQRRKYDIESWFPSQEKYRETHSDSYFLDFQARRLNMRYKTKSGEIKYVNTLNNTVAASPRLLACVVENYQQEDGTIKIPKVLQKYIGKSEIKA